jgi:hypothetical protein
MQLDILQFRWEFAHRRGWLTELNDNIESNMANIKSQSDRAAENSSSFFIPSAPAAVLYLLLASILLTIYSSGQILNLLGANYLNSQSALYVNFSTLTKGLNNSFSTAFGGRLGQIIVWSLVGAITYIGIWFVKNLINSFENDVIVDHYLHPQNFDRAGYWGSAFAGIVFFASVLIILLIYTFFILKVIMPGLSGLTNSSLTNFTLPKSVLFLLLCILISTFAIYLWTLVFKILTHLWKLL